MKNPYISKNRRMGVNYSPLFNVCSPILHKIGICVLLLVVAYGCEVVDRDKRFIDVDAIATETTVLLTEFTGVKCSNCPKAALVVEELLAAYPDTVIVVAMHPASNPFTQVSDYDYTCPAADEYYRYFGGVSTTGFPIGVVNFMKFDGDYFVDYSLWSGYLMSLLKQRPKGDFTLNVNQVEDSRQIRIDLTDIAGGDKAKYIVWLTEDSVQGLQYMPDNSPKADYWHNHILRDAISSVWGDNQTSWTYSVSEKYDLDHCAVVALMCDSNQTIMAAKRHSLHRASPGEDPVKEKDSVTLIIDGVGTLQTRDTAFDTTITITEVEFDQFENKDVMGFQGEVRYMGTLLVRIEREDETVDDELCCGVCTSTNHEKIQDVNFTIRGKDNLYAHLNPTKAKIYTVTYIFNPQSINPLRLTVHYDYRQK